MNRDTAKGENRREQITLEAVIRTISRGLREQQHHEETERIANMIKHVEIHCISLDNQARTPRELQLLTGKLDKHTGLLKLAQGAMALLEREHIRETEDEDERMESEDTPNDDDGMNTIREPNRTDSRTRTKMQQTNAQCVNRNGQMTRADDAIQ